jgi:uncharacterized protein YejL (UPF0352 family)
VKLYKVEAEGEDFSDFHSSECFFHSSESTLRLKYLLLSHCNSLGIGIVGLLATNYIGFDVKHYKIEAVGEDFSDFHSSESFFHSSESSLRLKFLILTPCNSLRIGIDGLLATNHIGFDVKHYKIEAVGEDFSDFHSSECFFHSSESSLRFKFLLLTPCNSLRIGIVGLLATNYIRIDVTHNKNEAVGEDYSDFHSSENFFHSSESSLWLKFLLFSSWNSLTTVFLPFLVTNYIEFDIAQKSSRFPTCSDAILRV